MLTVETCFVQERPRKTLQVKGKLKDPKDELGAPPIATRTANKGLANKLHPAPSLLRLKQSPRNELGCVKVLEHRRVDAALLGAGEGRGRFLHALGESDLGEPRQCCPHGGLLLHSCHRCLSQTSKSTQRNERMGQKGFHEKSLAVTGTLGLPSIRTRRGGSQVLQPTQHSRRSTAKLLSQKENGSTSTTVVFHRIAFNQQCLQEKGGAHCRYFPLSEQAFDREKDRYTVSV